MELENTKNLEPGEILWVVGSSWSITPAKFRSFSKGCVIVDVTTSGVNEVRYESWRDVFLTERDATEYLFSQLKDVILPRMRKEILGTGGKLRSLIHFESKAKDRLEEVSSKLREEGRSQLWFKKLRKFIEDSPDTESVKAAVKKISGIIGR